MGKRYKYGSDRRRWGKQTLKTSLTNWKNTKENIENRTTGLIIEQGYWRSEHLWLGHRQQHWEWLSTVVHCGTPQVKTVAASDLVTPPIAIWGMVTYWLNSSVRLGKLGRTEGSHQWLRSVPGWILGQSSVLGPWECGLWVISWSYRWSNEENKKHTLVCSSSLSLCSSRQHEAGLLLRLWMWCFFSCHNCNHRFVYITELYFKDLTLNIHCSSPPPSSDQWYMSSWVSPTLFENKFSWDGGGRCGGCWGGGWGGGQVHEE